MLMLLVDLSCLVLLGEAVSNPLLAKLQLNTGRGQVVEDVSGNRYHASNGNSLFPESADVVWTNQGGYFSGDQHLVVSSNAVTDAQLLLSQSFTLSAWIYPTEGIGYVAGKSTTLGFGISEPYIGVAYQGKYYYYSAAAFVCKFYAVQWWFISLCFEYTASVKTIYLRWNTQESILLSLSSSWVDPGSVPFKIGNNFIGFTGFIYDVSVYEGIVPLSDLEGSVLVTTDPACDVYPADFSGCLPTCSLDTSAQACTACYCEILTCGVPATCSACDTSCEEYCLNGCVDMTLHFCDPSPYSESSRVCEFSVDCSTNCYSCSTSAECLECDAGFFLDSNLQCTAECSGQYFGDEVTKECVLCHSDCASCVGPSATECTDCVAAYASIVDGTCLCDPGYYAANGQCSSCDDGCLTCVGPSGADCTVCDERFYLDSDGCKVCMDNCLSCSDTECWECVGNLVFSYNACVCEEPLVYYAEYCYDSFSLSIEFEDLTTLVVTTNDPTLSIGTVHLSVPAGYDIQWTLVNSSLTVFEWEVVLRPSSNMVLVTAEFVHGLFSEQGRILSPLVYTVEYHPPSTEHSPETSLGAQGYVGVSSVTTAMVIGLVSMVTLEDPSVMWTITQTAQLISYLPLLHIDITIDLFQFLLSFQTVFFLPNFLLDLLPQQDQSVPAAFEEYGGVKGEFVDVQFLRNGGRFFLVCAAVLVAQALLVAVTWYFAEQPAGQTRLKKMCSAMLRLWLELQLDLSVYAIVETPCLFASALSTALVLLVLVLNVVLPVLMLLVVQRNYKDIQEKTGDILLYTGTLFSGLKREKKFVLHFYLLMSLRKLVYCLSLYFLWESPLAFIGLHASLSFGIAVTEACVHIFEDRLSQVIQIIAESILCATLLLLLGIAEDFGVSQEVLEYSVMAMNITFIFGVSGTQTLRIIMACVRWLVNRRKAKATGPYVVPQDVRDPEILNDNSCLDQQGVPVPCYDNFFDQLSFKQVIPHISESR